MLLLAIELDLPSLLKFCSSSKRINNLVCNQKDIWTYKLQNEFPDYTNLGVSLSFRDTYTILYQLKTLKDKLNLKESIYELYNLKKLDLSMNIPLLILLNMSIL